MYKYIGINGQFENRKLGSKSRSQLIFHYLRIVAGFNIG